MADASASRTLGYSARGRGEPMLWLSAGALIVALSALLLLFGLLLVRGLSNFWPQPLMLVAEQAGAAPFLGVVLKRETSSSPPVAGAIAPGNSHRSQLLLYRGAAEVFQPAVLWLHESAITQRSWPERALVVERMDGPPVFGFLQSIESVDETQSVAAATAEDQVELLQQRAVLSRQGNTAQAEGVALLRLASGERFVLPLANLRDAYAPNAMRFTDRLRYFFSRLGAFLSESPRQVNAEGGVFPAIVGTVALVMVMSILVTPLGVLAAIYLQEYAHRTVVTRIVRIAVNNLAGVPSIVYGVFGLGFFVYAVGGSLDTLFFSDTLPTPTLGTPGLLWAALTMALLTMPVVIVATEEGLARVPQSLREGSLALGATRAETLWRVVLPAASPALLTGLILAVARATGEVAPLILVGVAKYAPVLPVSSEAPFLHLDRQFMHLGFHIYDLGFQSSQLDLTTGRVFSTALLLVLIVMALNLGAVILRGRLREAFKSQDLL